MGANLGHRLKMSNKICIEFLVQIRPHQVSTAYYKEVSKTQRAIQKHGLLLSPEVPSFPCIFVDVQ